MPQTTVLVYRKANGDVPLEAWLGDLSNKEPVAYAKCLERLLRLGQIGHELRRPHAAPLRDGIYELRADYGNVNYRILYFFHGQNVAVVSHGCTKEKKVPVVEIERAVARMNEVKSDQDKFTAEFEV